MYCVLQIWVPRTLNFLLPFIHPRTWWRSRLSLQLKTCEWLDSPTPKDWFILRMELKVISFKGGGLTSSNYGIAPWDWKHYPLMTGRWQCWSYKQTMACIILTDVSCYLCLVWQMAWRVFHGIYMDIIHQMMSLWWSRVEWRHTKLSAPLTTDCGWWESNIAAGDTDQLIFGRVEGGVGVHATTLLSVVTVVKVPGHHSTTAWSPPWATSAVLSASDSSSQ